MAELPYEHLIVADAAPHVTAVTLNRPDVLNAINTKLGEEIYAAFTALDDDPATRAIVLRGAGDRAFCTGADLKERAGMTDQVWHAQHRVFEHAFRSILECRHPVIAAIDGYALAGGLELALNCDIIIAGAGASFAQPEVMRGIMPGAGGTQLLPRLIGRGRAKELIFSGRRIDAATADRWGLVSRIVEAGSAFDEAVALATQIAANGPIAVRNAKRSIDRGLDSPLHFGLAVELDHYAACIPTEDRHEGIQAFNERRPPRFEGR
jgi:enoyl-CoA hydratase/carnithine racemase